MYNSTSNTLSVDQLIPYVRLARTEGIGAASYKKLLNQYKTAEDVIEILPSLQRTKKTSKKFQIPSIDSIKQEIDKTFNLGGQFLLLGFSDYPPLLNVITNPPPILTILGNQQYLYQRNVAIVGARNASLHGIKMAESLAADLAAQKIGITSGLARGIDGAAHKGALYTGFTIGVIACGIDISYPFEHQSLQKHISEKGVIITEFAVNTQPQSTHFPRRNRLIAGLCWGCVVIEAAQHSGSLITSKLALDYHKPIFAVPGSPLDPRCKGSNHLLRMGATFTETASDIIGELPTSLSKELFASSSDDLFSSSITKQLTLKTQSTFPPQNSHSQKLFSLESSILSLLSTTPTSVDLILRNISYPPTDVLSALTLLEINQKIIFSNNGYAIPPKST